jgi:nucleoside-diphosphate-sugar epimerase
MTGPRAFALTGASGFIGRHLRAAACAAGYDVRHLSHKVTDAARLDRMLEDTRVLVHLAARLPYRSRRHDAEPLFTAANVELTACFADAAVRAGVRRFVFVSSAGVLGRRSPPEGFDDTAMPAPYDAYTRSKLAAEALLLEEYSDRMEVVILRPPLVYGPDPRGLLGALLRIARSGWPLPVPAFDAPRSIVSVRNLCDLLLRACESPELSGVRMLAADRETVGMRDLARSIAAAAAPNGRAPRTIEIPAWLVRSGLDLLGAQGNRRQLDQPFVLHCTAAQERLGWRAPLRQPDEIAWSVRSRSAPALARA